MLGPSYRTEYTTTAIQRGGTGTTHTPRIYVYTDPEPFPKTSTDPDVAICPLCGNLDKRDLKGGDDKDK